MEEGFMATDISKFVMTEEDGAETTLQTGEVLTWKVLAETTRGRYDIVEFSTPPLAGPPEHIHAQDETCYILKGSYRIKMNEHVFTASEGTLLYFPAGISHTLVNCGTETAKMLVAYVPAITKEAFDDLATLDFSDEAALATYFEKYPTTISGPPLTL
jgi:quercetin dioxygenase-like cupin family protein